MNEVKAVLVRLSIRIFPNSRQDQQITDEVRVKKALGIGAGKWIKHLFPDEAFAVIREKGGFWRRRSYDLTLPWEDGLRLLPAKAHESYQQQFEEAKSEFWKAVDEFGSDYDGWIKKAKAMHNGTFDESLYPEWCTMRAKHFSFNVEFLPFPKQSHFITEGISKDAIAEMKADLEKMNKTRVEQAVKDTWTRLLIPVQNIADKLADKEAIFRNSLIDNVKQITALIPSLNLTNDTALAKVAKEIETKFANIDPKTLRNDNAVRKETSKAAKAVLKRFGAVGKRRFA